MDTSRVDGVKGRRERACWMPKSGSASRKYQHNLASVVSSADPGVRRVNDSRIGVTSSRHVRSTARRGGSQSPDISSSSSFSGDSISRDVSEGWPSNDVANEVPESFCVKGEGALLTQYPASATNPSLGSWSLDNHSSKSSRRLPLNT